MASAGKLSMQPVRITELIGLPKSAGKEPASERKRMEPVRVKQLLESASKSCSRTTDRLTRPTFVIPARGVRRKLYDRSPSPKAPRASVCPRSSSRNPSASQKPQNQPPPSRVSLFPQKLRQSLFPAKPQGKPVRKSFLLPPNSIVKNHMKVHENSVLETSRISEEEEDRKDEPEPDRDGDQLRPTVIMSNKSCKKTQRRGKEAGVEELGDEKKSEAVENRPEETDLEKSLENKENIPPAPEAAKNPLSESNPVPLDPQTSDVLQEALKRIEKLETDVSETRRINARILEVVEGIYDLLKNKREEMPRIPGVVGHIEGLDKENLMTNSRRSKNSPVNQVRRRSARLAKQGTPIPDHPCEDSFSVLEEQLNAKTPKLKLPTPKKTPVHDQFMRRRCKSERALREYLAIKANMSYLQTPEAGKLKSAQTPSGKGNLRRSISRKVFDELQDLYSDDPEESAC